MTELLWWRQLSAFTARNNWLLVHTISRICYAPIMDLNTSWCLRFSVWKANGITMKCFENHIIQTKAFNKNNELHSITDLRKRHSHLVPVERQFHFSLVFSKGQTPHVTQTILISDTGTSTEAPRHLSSWHNFIFPNRDKIATGWRNHAALSYTICHVLYIKVSRNRPFSQL